MVSEIPHLHPSRLIRLIAALAAYVLFGALLAYVIYYRQLAVAPASEGVFDLGFFFGPLIKNLATGNNYFGDAFGIRFTAHRMPLPPLLLAAVARVHNSLLWAVLVKNALLGALLVSAIYRMRHLLTRLPAVLVTAMALLGLSMPQVFHFTFSIEMEEGYTIAPILFLFVHFLWLVQSRGSNEVSPVRLAPWNAPTWVVLALVNGSLFLIKSSMLPTALLFAALFWIGARHWRVGALFLTCCCAAVLAWGLHNRIDSGQFAIGSSFDGWNCYKGNNELSARFYPTRTLDLLDDQGLIAAPPDVRGEWAFDAYYRKKLLAFLRERPLDEMRLFSLKFYVFFFSIGTLPLPSATSKFQRLMYDANAAYMVPFRILMDAVIIYSIWVVALKRRSMMNRARRGEAALAAWGFLLLVVCSAAPYLAGFAYQRHLVPLILPVIAYAAFLLDGFAQHRLGTLEQRTLRRFEAVRPKARSTAR